MHFFSIKFVNFLYMDFTHESIFLSIDIGSGKPETTQGQYGIFSLVSSQNLWQAKKTAIIFQHALVSQWDWNCQAIDWRTGHAVGPRELSACCIWTRRNSIFNLPTAFWGLLGPSKNVKVNFTKKCKQVKLQPAAVKEIAIILIWLAWWKIASGVPKDTKCKMCQFLTEAAGRLILHGKSQGDIFYDHFAHFEDWKDETQNKKLLLICLCWSEPAINRI